MLDPVSSFYYHPRNKNMVLGAIIEAIYYSQINKGKPDASILAELRNMVEHCTGCGRCTARVSGQDSFCGRGAGTESVS